MEFDLRVMKLYSYTPVAIPLCNSLYILSRLATLEKDLFLRYDN